MRRPHRRFAAVVLTLASLAPPAWALDVPSERTEWLALRTPHFLFVSDAPQSRVRGLALELERMVTAIGRVAPLLTRSPLPTEVFLFSWQGSFEDYCAAISGHPCKGLSGLFVPGRHGSYLLVSAGRYDEARATAFHELTHSFVNNSSPDVPLWLNEGFAEFYGSFSAVGNDVRIGRPEEQHLATLREKGFLPIATVLAVTHTSPEYSAAGDRAIFYAESWLLTHYLLVGSPTGRGQLSDYLTRTERGEDREQAFRAAFGIGTEDFKKELYGYSQRGTMFALRLKTADLAVPDPPKAQPLQRAEALGDLAKPLLDGGAGDLLAAKALLEEAHRVSPDSPTATALLAWTFGRLGDDKRSISLFEDATRVPPVPALAATLFAEHLLDRARRGDETGTDETPQEILRARALGKSAVAAEPDNVPALIAVGTSFLLAPGDEPGAGVRELERSLELAPLRSDAAVPLVQLLARAGQPDRAREIVRRYLLPSPDVTLRAAAMELMARVEIERAKVAASQQRFADAIDALKVALADSKDPALQAQIRSQLKQLRDTRDYNSAVTLANQGDRAGALVALNRLLPIVEDPGLRGLATDMRDRLAANEMSNDGAIAPPAAAQVPNKLKPDPDSARARALRREAQAQNEADRYNEAVALANHGKLKDALAITEDLAKNATNVTVKTAAAGLSDRLRARLAGTR